MHPAADADPQQLHARACAGGGTKDPDACISRDAIDLYLKVMTHNLWHARMPWLITNMGFSSAEAVARGFIWARMLPNVYVVAAQTWCQGDTYALSYFKKYLEEPAAVFFIAVVTVTAEEIDCPQWKLHAFLFSVFNGVCMSLLSVGRSRFTNCGVSCSIMFIIVQCGLKHLIRHRGTQQPMHQEKHLSKEAGTIDWVRLFEYNTGLSTPLRLGAYDRRVTGLSQLSDIKLLLGTSQGIHLWRLRIDFHNIFQFQVHSTLFCCFPFLWSIEYSLVLQTYYRRL